MLPSFSGASPISLLYYSWRQLHQDKALLEDLLLGLYIFWRGLERERVEDERRKLIPKNSPRIGFPHFGAASTAFETSLVSKLPAYFCRLTPLVLCLFLQREDTKRLYSTITNSIDSLFMSSSIMTQAQLEPTGPNRFVDRSIGLIPAPEPVKP